MATSSSSSTSRYLLRCVGKKAHHYISEETILQILSWTPATSLLRFRPVSKLFRSIISDPNFIRTHHTNSLKTPCVVLITSSASDEEEKETKYGRCSLLSRQAAAVVYSDSTLVNLKLVSPFNKMEFVSSCNGIICVSDARGNEVYLFNPLTRMCKKLALFNDQPPSVHDFDVEPFRVDVVFGFDCFSNEFKVLRIEYDSVGNMVQPVTVRGVYLYCFMSDSWKEVAVCITLPSFVCYAFCPVLISGPVIDGVLYLEGMNEIVTFDVHDQVFGLVVPFPSYLQTRKSNVMDFQGSVAVFAAEQEDDGSSNKIISLWTMEAISSNHVFWNKVFSSIDAGVDWVFEHFGANQFLGTNKLGQVVVYDFGKKEATYIGLPSQSFLVKVLKHSQSLLPIQGFEQIKQD